MEPGNREPPRSGRGAGSDALFTSWKAKHLRPFFESVKEHGLVLFVGAGASVPPPSRCPTWSALMNEILTTLLDRVPSKDLGWNETAIPPDPNLRPESFLRSMTLLLDVDWPRRMLRGLDSGTPNAIHFEIARLVHQCIARSVITTNFDTCIERALDSVGGRKYQAIRDEDEAATWLATPGLSMPIFKPHGCLTMPASMRFTLHDTQRLPESKALLLQQLIKGMAILFVGYSGNDEDLFLLLRESVGGTAAHACIVVYPGSPPNEPIQRWDVSDLGNVYRVVSEPLEILGLLRFSLDVRYSPPPATGRLKAGPSVGDWRGTIRETIAQLSPAAAAAVLAQLYADGGNQERSLVLAELAARLYEADLQAPHLWHSICAQRARALRELGRFPEALRIHGDHMNDTLSGTLGRSWDFVFATLDAVYTLLRQHDTERAEALLRALSPSLDADLLETDSERMAFLWYLGVLRRKQGHPDEAEGLLSQALEIAFARDDAWHLGRLHLDLGIVKLGQLALEDAQRLWGIAAGFAERATDWSTAAKASKNRGALLSLSDRPHLGPPELRRALGFFERANDPSGAARTMRMLGSSKSELMSELFFGQRIDDT